MLILILAAIPLSFIAALFLDLMCITVSDSQYGLVMSDPNAPLDELRIYDKGVHYVGGVRWKFHKFPSTIQFETMRNLGFVTCDGIQVRLDVSLQYRFIKERIPRMWHRFKTQYEQYMKHHLRSLLILHAQRWPIQQWIRAPGSLLEQEWLHLLQHDDHLDAWDMQRLRIERIFVGKTAANHMGNQCPACPLIPTMLTPVRINTTRSLLFLE